MLPCKESRKRNSARKLISNGAEKAEEAQVMQINRAIKEWKDQIVPTINSVIGRANTTISAAHLHLSANINESTTLAFGRTGPPIPPLPLMIVGARPSSPRVPIAHRLAGSQQRLKASLKDFARSPQLQFSIGPDGRLTIDGRNYVCKNQGTMAVTDFDERAAEKAVLEFVLAVMPK